MFISSVSLTGSHPHQVVVPRKITTSTRKDFVVWFPGRYSLHRLANRRPLKAPPGFVIWGALGCIAGICTLAIPGILGIEGPTTAALTGAVAGVITGGLRRRNRL